MERFYQDLRLGFRSLRRQPVVSLVAILTLALGVGANVAMVSFARSTAFPDLPYKDPDRLVVVQRWTEHEDSSYHALSYPVFLDWKSRQRVFSSLSLLQPVNLTMTDRGGDAERITGVFVSSDIFDTLGIAPALGRRFTSEEDRLGASPTVLLSSDFWRRRFGESEVLEQTLELDGVQHTIIGVLPPELSVEKFGATAANDIWLPLTLIDKEFSRDDRKQQSDAIVIVSRLRSGVSIDSAQKDMARITEELALEYSGTDSNKKVSVTALREYLVGSQRPIIQALVAAVAFLLAIVCVNLVNLLLARFIARQHEFAVRMALGAGRRHLVIQGLNEALALASVGSLAGLISAAAVVRWMSTTLPDIPYAHQVRISPSILAFTVVLCLVVTLAIGLVPSMRTILSFKQRLLTSSLTSRSFHEQRRLHQLLVVGEIALATVLVTGAGLAFISFLHQRNEDLGFSTDRTLAMDTALPLSEYPRKSDWVAYFDRVLERVSRLPEVEDIALTTDLPMGDLAGGTRVYADGHIPDIRERPLVFYYTVSPNYFHAMGIRIVEGEGFTAQNDDRPDSKRAAMVSENLARKLWPNKPAIGRQVGFEVGGGTMEEPDVLWREVVGIVADVRYNGIRKAPPFAVYVSYTQRPFWYDMNSGLPESPKMSLVAKTTVEPGASIGAVRAALATIDPKQPAYGVRTLQEIVEGELNRTKLTLALLSSFAGLAVILALVGIYGVVSYIVTAKTQEIGIRKALGASPRQVLMRLLLANLALILMGIAAGLGLAAALASLMAKQLYGVSPLDPGAFLLGGLLMAVMALFATVIPAVRAARISPLDALRHE